jgi:hypothetical protein
VTRWQESHGTDDRAICAGDRLTNADSASDIRCPASSHSRGKRPDPNARTAAQSAAVAVSFCCTRCSIRSNFASELWSYGDSNPRPLACHPAATRPQ